MYRVIKNIPLEESEDGFYFSDEELDEDNRFLLTEGAMFKNKVPVIEKYPDCFEFIPDETSCEPRALEVGEKEECNGNNSI